MAKTKKYIFKAESGVVKLSFIAKTDVEAFTKLGTIVQDVSYFTSMRKYRIK